MFANVVDAVLFANSRFWNAEVPIIVPESLWGTVPERVVVPELCLNVALFVKFPVMVSLVEGAVTAPEEASMKKLPIVAGFAPKDFVPDPRKVVVANADAPVIVPERVCAEVLEK